MYFKYNVVTTYNVHFCELTKMCYIKNKAENMLLLILNKIIKQQNSWTKKYANLKENCMSVKIKLFGKSVFYNEYNVAFYNNVVCRYIFFCRLILIAINCSRNIIKWS